MKFSIYFMGYESEEDVPKTDKERRAWCLSRKATLELTQYVSYKLYYRLYINPHHLFSMLPRFLPHA